MRRSICLLIIVWISLAQVSPQLVTASESASPNFGSRVSDKAGQGASTAVKGVFNGVGWIFKGTYAVIKYVVVEVFRPIRPITNMMVKVFGVETVEET